MGLGLVRRAVPCLRCCHTMRKRTALDLMLHVRVLLVGDIILILLLIRNNASSIICGLGRQRAMSASYAVPLHGAATRTLPQAAATTMEVLQPSTAVHMPPIPIADLRPVDPRTQYGLALAVRAPAATAYVPAAQSAPTKDSGLRNLGAAARPKTWWGVL